MGEADLPAGRMSPKGGVLWALIPLFTVGLGTMFVLAWAAHRLRSRALGVSAVVALIMTVVALPLSGAPNDSVRGAASTILIILLIGGGLTATFMIRQRLIGPPTVGPVAVRTGGADPALGAALQRRQRRAEARRILERDPSLARELRIGRPDLPRQFDDGGLIDVNHVPVAVLATLPGFTPELAERVARSRDEHHGFAFVQELEVYANLPGGGLPTNLPNGWFSSVDSRPRTMVITEDLALCLTCSPRERV
ncbi:MULTISPECIES: helix-hairpin-helix domain-containing protein [unclassified Streptomyces]|uniref:ComEA family DNA-binding protein n=1 Tax=unclassified Streptomyces TaxID=2593676 RepID=UPI002035B12D|nr:MULTISPECIES: helix-hairpin-helix domain-containing protein [unclassified Streptomyces]